MSMQVCVPWYRKGRADAWQLGHCIELWIRHEGTWISALQIEKRLKGFWVGNCSCPGTFSPGKFSSTEQMSAPAGTRGGRGSIQAVSLKQPYGTVATDCKYE